MERSDHLTNEYRLCLLNIVPAAFLLLPSCSCSICFWKVIRNGSPEMKFENFGNKIGLTDCKWSGLSAPGQAAETHVSHPLLRDLTPSRGLLTRSFNEKTDLRFIEDLSYRFHES